MTNTAVYMRISTKNKGQTFSSQRNEIEKFLASNLDTTFDDSLIYKDQISGKATKRPSLLKLQNDILYGRGNIKQVVLYSLDRISRRGTLDVISFLSFLDSKDVKVFFVKDPYLNTNDSFIRSILITVLSELAKKEGERISERVKNGIESYRKKNPNRPWGRKKSLPRKEIIKLYNEGHNKNQISKQLKCAYSSVFAVIEKGIADGHCKPSNFNNKKKGN
jgi:DNA invertase Pin-like site-specific DNA recombinase